MGVDEARQHQLAGMVLTHPAPIGLGGLAANDAAVFDQQPVVAVETHRGRLDIAPGRRGGEVQKIATQRPTPGLIDRFFLVSKTHMAILRQGSTIDPA